MSIISLPQPHTRQVADSSTDAISQAQDTKLQAVAEQFEALFLQQVLKQMRKAGDVLSAENSMSSRELNTMRDFYDGTLAETLAQKRQTGIADMLVKQLSNKQGEAPAIAQAEALAREAPLPQRTASLAEPLRSTWQRDLDGGAKAQPEASTVARAEAAPAASEKFAPEALRFKSGNKPVAL